jgi:hypothetical protein
MQKVRYYACNVGRIYFVSDAYDTSQYGPACVLLSSVGRVIMMSMSPQSFFPLNTQCQKATGEHQGTNDTDLRKLPIISMNNLGSNSSAKSIIAGEILDTMAAMEIVPMGLIKLKISAASSRGILEFISIPHQ